MKKRAKRIWSISVLILLLAGGYILFLLPTRIVFVNFNDSNIYDIVQANKNPFIKIKFIDFENSFSSIVHCDAIYFSRVSELTQKQISNLERASNKGIKINMMSTQGDHLDFTNITDKDKEYVNTCLNNTSVKNFELLLDYTRQELDGKKLFSNGVLEPEEFPDDAFYRIGTEDYFTNTDDYFNYCKEKGLYKDGRPVIAIVNIHVTPQTSLRTYQDELILNLENRGYNVVSLSGRRKRLENLKAVNPDMVIYFARGRLASGKSDETIEWLKKNNILVLAPLLAIKPYDEWLNDKQGMTGKLVGQYVVIPEMDGATTPYVIAAKKQMEEQDKSYLSYQPIEERIEQFCEYIDHWMKLRAKRNAEKKVCIYYYKGPGKNALVAGGLEVGPSLLNVLRELKAAGYTTGDLPSNTDQLLARLQKEGPVLGEYAKGSFKNFVEQGNPELIPVDEYKTWCRKCLDTNAFRDVVKMYGEAPGDYLSITKNDTSYLVIPRVRFGNIALLPVLPAALNENEFKYIHGVKHAPPHAYIASYLWAREKFQADAIVHFGTHGSLEFTPGKQLALTHKDWPEALTFPLPHLYVYTINNIGEAMLAKRRTYATMLSHLTASFSEADIGNAFTKLNYAIDQYEDADNDALKAIHTKTIQYYVDSLGLAEDLEIPAEDMKECNQETIELIHNYLHHLNDEKITIGLHVLGESYTDNEITETVRMMSVDALSTAMEQVAVLNGENGFPHSYFKDKADRIILDIVKKNIDPRNFIASEDIQILDSLQKCDTLTMEDQRKLQALLQYKEAVEAIPIYHQALIESSGAEINALLNGLKGGYIAPSSGGDPVSNPEAVPTGRNLFSLDAENTPTKEAWETGKKLGDMLLKQHLAKHGSYPKKIAYSLWGGEFIRNEGINIAQVLYMLGVKPVWNMVGRVYDVELITSEELKRPRIDVVVQTSGQFRDIAASRIYLINKAVEIAAHADDHDAYPNYVREGTFDAEELLKGKGLSPADARLFSTARVFGGLNGSYGTGIMGMVEKGDAWETQDEIASQYINNMDAVYTAEYWAYHQEGIFETMLHNTEVVVHPRSSNINGPVSLDHVYEFMGGVSAAIRKVTGKSPDAYFNDNRNKYNPKVQGLREAIQTEVRTNAFNPKYIEEQMKEGATAAESFSEIFRNTYAWNALKPDVVNENTWEKYYDIYIRDTLNLDIINFFKDKNPYAMQEMTAVMLESARKGFWDPNQATLKELTKLHVELIRDYEAGCSGFVCDNAKLHDFIEKNISNELKEIYINEINRIIEEAPGAEKNGMILEKEVMNVDKVKEIIRDNLSAVITLLITMLIFVAGIVLGIIKRRRE
ncbi:MAG: cobaltochelatase subunit CobN [Bacteroidales bacterium]|nr:cobaltochelatase subunit CobN [Bacteroidales bacterium]